jgi:hypothetical protein
LGLGSQRLHFIIESVEALTLNSTDNEGREDSFDRFLKTMTTKNLMHLKSQIYKNLEHLGTAVISLEDGVEFVLRK